MPETVRSFIAFDIDNQSVLRKLTDAQRLITQTGADLKLVEPNNIHITMRFLGDISIDSVEKIFGEMKQIQFTPFDVKLQGIGVFPDLRYPRVLWVGITQGADQLKSVFSQLEPRLQGLSFAPDPKGFSPHLTIARVKSGRNKADLGRVVTENVNYEFGIVGARCLRIKKSDLTPKGPIYTTLREFCPQA
jgi:2'-5' RNA ligase